MTAYRLWPSTNGDSSFDANTTHSFGVEFEVSQSVGLTGIFWWSFTGSVALPDACAIYDIATTAQVAGTLKNSPSWSGAAGSGWVKVTYDGSVTLVSGKKYKAVVHITAGASASSVITNNYWSSGPGSAGITNGPLSAPNATNADSGLQDTIGSGGVIGYPSSGFASSNWWVDVEVTPLLVVAVSQQQQSGRSMLRKRLMYADV